MTSFFGRRDELIFLEAAWASTGPQLVILYGKRRVGKTELALRFARDKPHIYFLADQLPDSLQLRRLSQQVGEFFDDELLVSRGFGEWDELFKYLGQKNDKLILIVDEFPYLVDSQLAIPSIFQRGWDLHLKNSQLFLLLTGSSVGMMERTTLSPKAPLYGRRTGQIHLRPFRFTELEEIFPESDFETRLLLYGILGGTIAYLMVFRETADIWQRIAQTTLTREHFLYQEVEFLLREELKEYRNYFAILRALSLGKAKLSEIINETGFDKGIVSKYLSVLNELGITRREVPVTEKNPEKSRKGIYRIDDMFFHFWFRYVFPNRYLIEAGQAGLVLQGMKRDATNLLAVAYERVAPAIYDHLARTGALPRFPYLGRWWENGLEIDLVGTDPESNRILLGEVKWTAKPIGTNILEDLKRKASQVAWGNTAREEIYCLLARRGFAPALARVAAESQVHLIQGDRLVS